jgi:membrane protease YdiL (CAAX protease family)
MTDRGQRSQPDSRWSPTAVFLLLAMPFYLNDISNLLVSDWRTWLVIDYTFVKAFPIGLAVWLVATDRASAAAFGLRKVPLSTFLVAFTLSALLGTVIDQNAYRLIDDWYGYGALGGMPRITSTAWDWFDLTAGLLIVGLVEEMVFRGWLAHTLCWAQSRAGIHLSGWQICLCSALSFGAIHWSLGFHAVLVTGLIGGVYMAMYRLTRSVVPIALGHFMVNFVDFAGVVPKTWFQLPGLGAVP